MINSFCNFTYKTSVCKNEIPIFRYYKFYKRIYRNKNRITPIRNHWQTFDSCLWNFYHPIFIFVYHLYLFFFIHLCLFIYWEIYAWLRFRFCTFWHWMYFITYAILVNIQTNYQKFYIEKINFCIQFNFWIKY